MSDDRRLNKEDLCEIGKTYLVLLEFYLVPACRHEGVHLSDRAGTPLVTLTADEDYFNYDELCRKVQEFFER